MVDRCVEGVEEARKRLGVCGVECRGAERAELARWLLKAFGITAGEDHLGAFGPCLPGGFEPDSRAAADHDDSLRPVPAHGRWDECWSRWS
jgi:hypothetical protein